MRFAKWNSRTLSLMAIIISLLGIFIFVAVRSGPLAPVTITVSTVESQSIVPELAGIGTVQARFTYKIGPAMAGKIKSLNVDVGNYVEAGQILGEMDAIDISERIRAQEAAIKSSEAAVLQAQAQEDYATVQAQRYEKLLLTRATSDEMVVTKRQELAIARVTLSATQANVERQRAEREVLLAQLENLKLVAQADGLVISRNAEPGSTVVAGQAVIEIIDPTSLWIDARFDQNSAEGLAADLPTKIILRSRQSQTISGKVLWIEPKADAITEEMLAKIVFTNSPTPLPSLGELAEVSVQLNPLPAAPVILNAAIRTLNGQRGVWKIADGELRFVPVTLGRMNLEGYVQILTGLDVGDQVVLYSDKTLGASSRIKVIEQLAGVAP